MFGRQQNSNQNASLTYLVMGAICFATGYGIAKYQYNNAEVKIVKDNESNYTLSYRQSAPRVLTLENGTAKLGTLRQRLDDLLSEEPQRIRQLTKESLSSQ